MAKIRFNSKLFGRVVTPPSDNIRVEVLTIEMGIYKLIFFSDLDEIQILKICNDIVANLECLALENMKHNNSLPKFQERYDQVTSLVREVMQTHDLPGWEGL